MAKVLELNVGLSGPHAHLAREALTESDLEPLSSRRGQPLA
jgi:hypothetical protein